MHDDYIQKNRELWNLRAERHLESEFYDVKSFLEGRNSLNKIELDLLGDVKGKRILHLQCHFGQDTLSLARMGAEVTGADFSDSAIEAAAQLASKLGIDAEFVCCDIYALTHCLMKEFDIVFTSYGTIGWLPDLDRWAKIISGFLVPGGKFIMADFHPVIWMYDDEIDKTHYSYFNRGPIVEVSQGSYADAKGPLQESISWNHSISELLESLLKNGLRLDSFSEYDYSPYNCFKDMTEIEPGKFQIKAKEGILPMVYSLLMVKSGS
jgi:SAM-dependent methyltransferase